MGDMDDVFQILIATDNHLGFCDKDPVRGDDSFAAFEEILLQCKARKVDMLLLGGDLFHDNKPSRRAMHATIRLLREHTLGDEPVKFQVISDQAQNFAGSGNRRVNYEDPYTSVSVPVFSIHGNHDDPTREGNVEALAALDLLAASNLVNYFGRSDKVDATEIMPILVKKGSTYVAIYGLGNMRDERLNRMWQQRKVKFLRPEATEGRAKFFSIFVLHQNRDLGRGHKSCVHESMIPEWMDLVVWGHEHESAIKPRESAVGTFRVTQPGSSVATSLVEGEAAKKHVGLLQIKGDAFRLEPVRLTMVRPFVIDEVVLADFEDLQGALNADDVDNDVAEVLAARVTTMIQDARMAAEAPRFPNQLFQLKQPDQVLVRLKVDHTNFAMINNQRFGGRFVGQAANPASILHFTRFKKQAERREKSSTAEAFREPVEEGELDPVQIKDLVLSQLEMADKKLSLLAEPLMNSALDDFVHKSEAGAFTELVEEQLTKSQRECTRDKAVGDEDAIRDAIQHRTYEARKAAGMSEAAPKPASRKAATKHSVAADGDDEDEAPPPKAKGQTNSQPAAKKKKKTVFDEEEDDEEDDKEEEDDVVPKKRARTAAAKKPVVVDDFDDDDDDDDEDDEPPVKRRPAARKKPAAKKAPAPRKAASRKAPIRDDSEDAEVDDDDDDDDDDEPLRTTARRSSHATKVNFASDVADDDDDDDGCAANVDETIDDDDDDDMPPPPKKATRAAPKKAAAAAKPAPKKAAPKRTVPWSQPGESSTVHEVVDISAWDD